MKRTRRDQDGERLAFSEEIVSRLNASLDAHDARTGIFLAAIALMVTGGLAALSDQTIRDARFILPNGSRLALPALSLGLFLIFTVAAATYLVLSLGPPEPPPRSQSEPSLIRASSIETDQWRKFLLADTAQLEILREEVYYRDSQYLSHRALYKYQRLVEARSAFFLSLPFLLLFVIIVMFLGNTGSYVRLSWTAATLGGVVLLLTTFVAGQDRIRIDLIDQTADDDATDSRTSEEDRYTFGVLAICLAANAALTLISVLVSKHFSAEDLLPIMSFIVVLPAAWKLAERRRSIRGDPTRRRALDRLPPYFVVSLGVPGLVFGLIPEVRSFCLIAAFLPSLLFEGIRLLDFYFSPYLGPSIEIADNADGVDADATGPPSDASR